MEASWVLHIFAFPTIRFPRPVGLVSVACEFNFHIFPAAPRKLGNSWAIGPHRAPHPLKITLSWLNHSQGLCPLPFLLAFLITVVPDHLRINCFIDPWSLEELLIHHPESHSENYFISPSMPLASVKLSAWNIYMGTILACGVPLWLWHIMTMKKIFEVLHTHTLDNKFSPPTTPLFNKFVQTLFWKLLINVEGDTTSKLFT